MGQGPGKKLQRAGAAPGRVTVWPGAQARLSPLSTGTLVLVSSRAAQPPLPETLLPQVAKQLGSLALGTHPRVAGRAQWVVLPLTALPGARESGRAPQG